MNKVGSESVHLARIPAGESISNDRGWLRNTSWKPANGTGQRAIGVLLQVKSVRQLNRGAKTSEIRGRD